MVQYSEREGPVKSYYENEEEFAEVVRRRTQTNKSFNKVCPSTKKDWRIWRANKDGDCNGPGVLYICMICDTLFEWKDGPGHLTSGPRYHPDDLSEGRLNLANIPWWGWGVVLAVVPFAIPICLVGITVDAIHERWKK